MKWFKERFSEPSSWTALGGFLAFIGVLTKDDNLPTIAEGVANQAQTMANGDYVTGIMGIISALAFGLGFAKSEKK